MTNTKIKDATIWLSIKKFGKKFKVQIAFSTRRIMSFTHPQTSERLNLTMQVSKSKEVF